MTKRVTIIDGKEIIVEKCGDCPFYDGGDDGYGEHCNYPGGNRYPWENDRIFHYSEDSVGEDCPLKEEPNKADKERYLMEATRLPKCVSRELDMSNAPDWLKAKFKKATQ